MVLVLIWMHSKFVWIIRNFSSQSLLTQENSGRMECCKKALIKSTYGFMGSYYINGII
jgi:hypothetical protein